MRATISRRPDLSASIRMRSSAEFGTLGGTNVISTDLGRRFSIAAFTRMPKHATHPAKRTQREYSRDRAQATPSHGLIALTNAVSGPPRIQTLRSGNGPPSPGCRIAAPSSRWKATLK